MRNPKHRERRTIDRSTPPEPLVVELEGGGQTSITDDDLAANDMRNARRTHAHYLGELAPPIHPTGKALLKARYIPPALYGEAERQRRVENQLRGGD